MAWTKLDDPTTEWTTLTRGGWFITRWFQGWFRDLYPSFWTKLDDPVTTWTTV